MYVLAFCGGVGGCRHLSSALDLSIYSNDFCIGTRQESSLILLHVDIRFFQPAFADDALLYLSQCVLMTFVETQVSVAV